MNNKILLFFSSLIGSNSISAQIITAGTISSIAGSVNNSTISINYSVGEVAIKTISNFSVSLIQGFLQPKLVITTGLVEISFQTFYF